MRYLSLPGTDLEVSQICLGSAEFGLKTDRAETFRLLDTFIARGGTFVDTAHCYSDWVPGEASRSEKVIGQWLEERGNRSRIVLATKGGIDFHKPGNPVSLSEKDLDDDIGESLENLRTGTIDLYWLHRDEPSRGVDEIVRTLDRNVRRGRIRHLGCSNWRPERIAAANAFARANGLSPFVASQVEWSLARMFKPETPFDASLPFMDPPTYRWHAATRFPAVAFSSQARGFFSVLHRHGEAALPERLRTHCLNERTRRAYERLTKLSAQTGETVEALCLAAISSQTAFTGIPIIFTSRMEHLLESLAGADTHLTPEQLAFLVTG